MSHTLKGLNFDETAPVGVIEALVEAATSGHRVHVNYGDPVTGRVSLDPSDSCFGYVGRSAMKLPCPSCCQLAAVRGAVPWMNATSSAFGTPEMAGCCGDIRHTVRMLSKFCPASRL